MPVTAETTSEAPPAGGADGRPAAVTQERPASAAREPSASAAQQRPAAAATERPAASTPERSLIQRKQALGLANAVRTQRADLKRELKAGRVTIQSLLLSPPQYLLTAKVYDFLLAVPKYGRVKTNRVLKHCRVSPSKTFGGLSKRQRDEIVAYLSR